MTHALTRQTERTRAASADCVRMAEAARLDYEAWHGTKAPYDVQDIVVGPTPARRTRGLSFYLVGVLTGLLIAWGVTAFALHMETRVGADLAHAEAWRRM